MNIDEMIGNDKMHSFCLPVETCVVCGDRASGWLNNNLLLHFLLILLTLLVFSSNHNFNNLAIIVLSIENIFYFYNS